MRWSLRVSTRGVITNVGAKVTPITVNYSDSILTDWRRFYPLELTGGIR